MEAEEKFAPQLGTATACRAFGVPRASLYRRRQQEAAPRALRCRPPSHRALTEVKRQEVLDVLHSERFLDQAPARVAAALLDEDRYLCSVRTMYRNPGCESGSARTAEPAAASRLREAGTVGDRAESGVELGHHEAERTTKVDLLPVRDPGHLQPPGGGLDGGRLRILESGEKS